MGIKNFRQKADLSTQFGVIYYAVYALEEAAAAENKKLTVDDYKNLVRKLRADIKDFDINAKNRYGDTPLIWLVQRKGKDGVSHSIFGNAIQAFKDEGADPFIANLNGKSAMSYALELELPHIAKLFNPDYTPPIIKPAALEALVQSLRQKTQ